MAFQPGQTIGDYEVVAKLGAGGLGVVYEVRHVISQRREAMKILLPDQEATPEMMERFRREVQTLAALNHVHIAALHNAFYHEGQLAMVMELIHGETLARRRQSAAATLPWVLEITAQVLRALDYAHRLGVVHRDIKPSNVMITHEGVVKLLDFGIALAGPSSELTKSGYLLGSLNYMSPEQVSAGKATARSDLYSVGIMLYELLTGTLPITGASSYEIMVGHMQRIPAPPHTIAPQVPLALSSAVMRALEKDPAHRFASADEFLQALQHAPMASDAATALTMPLPQPHPPAANAGLRPSAGSGSQKQAGSGAGSGSGGTLALPLGELSRRLAVYIGPVAAIVVKKLAAQSEDVDFIYREAAKQICNDADRAAFLRSRHQ